jgi:hypothetical protein
MWACRRRPPEGPAAGQQYAGRQGIAIRLLR